MATNTAVPPPHWLDAEALRLKDFAEKMSKGGGFFTYDDVLAKFSWSYSYWGRVKHRLRLVLASEGFNLHREPRGKGEQHAYFIASKYEDQTPSAIRNARDAQSRIEVAHALYSSIAVAHSDRRTAVGRRAHDMEASLRHLMEKGDIFIEEAEIEAERVEQARLNGPRP